MDKPVLVTTPASLSVKAFPILIIDKKGEIGFSLAEALKFSFLPLVVSSASPQKEMGLVHIPYQKSFPRLPNNTFSHIIIVFNGEKDIVAKLPKLLKKSRGT